MRELSGVVCSDPKETPAVLSQPSQIELLLKTVESELIPRLFVNHLMDVPVTSPLIENCASEPQSGPWSTSEEISVFAELCIGDNRTQLDQHVTDLLARGVTLESIFLHLLSPVARFLGDQWLCDKLTFVDVHLGLCRLHQLICECEAIGYRSENMPLLDTSILLGAAPGEDHIFGITMVADFFRRYGWRVSNLCGLEPDFLLARLASTSYSVVGFSLHSERNFDGLKKIIKEVRSVAINPDIVVMVGGDYFIRETSQVSEVGADLFCMDGHQAVLHAINACNKLKIKV